jgi:CheY-like chemotaxis protein
MSDLESKIALVVDDEQAQVEFVSAILDDQKMKTITASNGKEAMQKITETKPDVILLDLMMPEESGMKFFNQLKKNKDYEDIPVIVVSGASQVTGVDLKSIIYEEEFAERKKKVFGIDAAPDAYLEKPVDPTKLVDIIKGFLSS